MVTVAVSGYFDPLHIGHLDYIKKSAKLGDKLIAIINNNNQSVLKKGKYFMSDEERMEIVSNLKHVDEVFLSIDDDRSVCRTLAMIKPDIFTNGGDVTDGCAEEDICRELGIKLVYGLGEKIQSSSWLTK